jgi:hypothetical protein
MHYTQSILSTSVTSTLAFSALYFASFTSNVSVLMSYDHIDDWLALPHVSSNNLSICFIVNPNLVWQIKKTHKLVSSGSNYSSAQ